MSKINNAITSLFNSKYGVLLVGFLLTGIVGVWFNYSIQNQIAQRERDFELHKRNLDTAEETLEQTSNLVNARLFYLQRVVWAYSYGEAEDAKIDYKDYRDTLTYWNIHDMAYAAKLKRYYGTSIGSNFFQDNPNKRSLYKYFFLAHRALLDWKSCLMKVCSKVNVEVCETDACETEKGKSLQSLSQLRDHALPFVESLNSIYETKYLHKKATKDS